MQSGVLFVRWSFCFLINLSTGILQRWDFEGCPVLLQGKVPVVIPQDIQILCPIVARALILTVFKTVKYVHMCTKDCGSTGHDRKSTSVIIYCF